METTATERSFMKKRWTRFARRLGLEKEISEKIFAALQRSYQEPRRYYHTLTGHIAFCIDEFEKIRRFAENPLAVEAALWFHDAVYIPGQPDNEKESIALMQILFLEAKLPGVFIAEVVRLMNVTKHKRTPRDCDAMLISGIDLLTFAQSPAVFWRYDRNIRKEYAFVPITEFRRRRAKILGRFLKRPKIYPFPVFHKAYEEKARKNLRACMKRLRGY